MRDAAAKRITHRGWSLLVAGLLLTAVPLLVSVVRGSSSLWSGFLFAALCRSRRLPGPRRELPDLQRAVAVPDEPMDIPRTSVGKPELHGFAVQGASWLREDPASPAFLHREREFRDGGRRDLRARQLCRSASIRLPRDAPALLLRGRSVRRDRLPDGTWRPVHWRVHLRATASRAFNDGGAAAGISAQNGTYDFSGGGQDAGVFSTGRGYNDHNQVALSAATLAG